MKKFEEYLEAKQAKQETDEDKINKLSDLDLDSKLYDHVSDNTKVDRKNLYNKCEKLKSDFWKKIKIDHKLSNEDLKVAKDLAKDGISSILEETDADEIGFIEAFFHGNS